MFCDFVKIMAYVSWQVLSELLADLEACDVQKGDAKVLANGEEAPGESSCVTKGEDACKWIQ